MVVAGALDGYQEMPLARLTVEHAHVHIHTYTQYLDLGNDFTFKARSRRQSRTGYRS